MDDRYAGGQNFEASLSPGNTIELVDVKKAPSAPGTDSTSWRIVFGKNQFCPMALDLTIVVQ